MTKQLIFKSMLFDFVRFNLSHDLAVVFNSKTVHLPYDEITQKIIFFSLHDE